MPADLHYMAYSNIIVVEGLDVTLDDLLGLRKKILVNYWIWVFNLSE